MKPVLGFLPLFSATELITWTPGDSSDNTYKLYDYSKLTTVIAKNQASEDFIEFVKGKGPNVVQMIGDDDVNTDRLTNQKYFNSSLTDLITLVESKNLDGLNLNFEGDFTIHTPYVYPPKEKQAIVDFCSALKENLPTGTKLSYNFPYSPRLDPACVTARCLLFYDIGQVVDYVIVKSFNANFQLKNAQPTDPYKIIIKGFEEYIKQFYIPTNKLIQTVPFFGSKYPCQNDPVSEGSCLSPLAKKYNTDIDIPLSDVWPLIRTGKSQGFEPSLNKQSKTNEILVQNANVTFQIWFDDAQTISSKFQGMALKNDILGIAAWDASDLVYDNNSEDYAKTQNLWETLNETFDQLSARN